VLIPHIVRAQEITETNLRGVASGSDTVVKLNYAPRRTTSKPQAAQSVPSTAVSFAPARAETRPGSTISVNLDVETATDLFTAPLRIKFDPKILRLNDAGAGNLLTLDGKQAAPLTKNIMNDIGEASVTLARLPGSGGVSGSGTLVTLVFEALPKGTASVSLSDLSLQDSMRRQIAAAHSQLTIIVK